MDTSNVFTLINQSNGHLAFKLFTFSDNTHFDHLQRNNFYTVLWVKKGQGLLKVDSSEHSFTANTMCTFAPYQPFLIATTEQIQGICIQFHSDFYCIHRNPNETHCDTVLFNAAYRLPMFVIDDAMELKFNLIITQLQEELTHITTDNYELLVSFLKIFLVTASRIKIALQPETPKIVPNQVPFILHQLKELIEHHFREKHLVKEYAKLLHISPNALTKLVTTHFHKTLTMLIQERIIIEAKRELYMTNTPIKEIAWSLGYTDEYYFSRVFKKNTSVSPKTYRQTVGFGKAELN